jgi:hypothetical protein
VDSGAARPFVPTPFPTQEAYRRDFFQSGTYGVTAARAPQEMGSLTPGGLRRSRGSYMKLHQEVLRCSAWQARAAHLGSEEQEERVPSQEGRVSTQGKSERFLKGHQNVIDTEVKS